MRYLLFLLAAGAHLFLDSTPSAADCHSASAIGVSRTIAIDTKGGGLYGEVQYDRSFDLKDGEIVLTFDDGPHPRHTLDILQTLSDHCTKATFFAVGQMARTYPETIRKVHEEGHTIAAHTHSHPDLRNMSFQRAAYEIERGFAELIQASGKPVAPFFRFPGLGHSKSLNAYLAKRNIATVSVDIISNDSYYRSPRSIISNTLALLERKKKGIILFHDLKGATAEALPVLLEELKERDYKVVHIKPKESMKKADYDPLPLNRSTSQKKRRLAGNKTSKKGKRKKKNKNTKIATRSETDLKVKHKPVKLCFFLLFGCTK